MGIIFGFSYFDKTQKYLHFALKTCKSKRVHKIQGEKTVPPKYEILHPDF